MEQIQKRQVLDDEGLAGFGKGAFEKLGLSCCHCLPKHDPSYALSLHLRNAVYFLPEAMVWFGVYEALKGLSNSGPPCTGDGLFFFAGSTCVDF